jgi:hypothetical protein
MSRKEFTVETFTDKLKVMETVENLPDGKWLVKVVPFDEARSAAQNRLLWKWNKEIGDYYGYTKDEMHEYFKERYLIRIKMETSENFVALANAINTYPKESDEYKQAAKALAAEITTRSLRVKQMFLYLARIKTFALHEGIPITIPKQDELDWLLGMKRNRPKETGV